MMIYSILMYYGVFIINHLGYHFLVTFAYMGGVYKHQL